MRRMLIVDDEPGMCRFLSRFFQQTGFVVDATTSPEEALSRIATQRPDLLLLDVRLGGVSGLELLRTIRELTPGLRVVMVSALEDEATAQEALRLGAVDYVTKPLTLDPQWWAERFFGYPPAPQQGT
ncbi:MAG: response regulator [Candidatus Omnitrophica bacterium]|nr:response regulator [Candidatus Omnitrophota bacterium]